MDHNMEQRYNPKVIEKKWQEYWAEHETFKTDVWDSASQNTTYLTCSLTHQE